MRLFRKSDSPASPPPTLEHLQEVAKQNRRERRAEERRNKIISQRESARVCWRCGFGALKGIQNSHLVRMKDNEGNTTWGHAYPTVCAGSVRAITSQARMTPKEALIDLLNVTWATFKGSRFAQFLLTEDSNEIRRGYSPVHPRKHTGDSRHA